jgi:transposase
MLMLPPSVRVFIATDPVDMRRSFAGLAAVAREHLGKDPMDGHLFVFLGRRRDCMKVLWWDRDGWALFYKRLERGTFCLPQKNEDGRDFEIGARELGLMLEGIDLKNVRRRRRWQPKTDDIT